MLKFSLSVFRRFRKGLSLIRRPFFSGRRSCDERSVKNQVGHDQFIFIGIPFSEQPAPDLLILIHHTGSKHLPEQIQVKKLIGGFLPDQRLNHRADLIILSRIFKPSLSHPKSDSLIRILTIESNQIAFQCRITDKKVFTHFIGSRVFLSEKQTLNQVEFPLLRGFRNFIAGLRHVKMSFNIGCRSAQSLPARLNPGL